MNETMVERLAKALQQAHHHRGRGIAPWWDALDKFERYMWMYSARAAIEAMRNPPDTITVAVERKIEAQHDAVMGLQRMDGHDVWNAGIDAALAEGQSDE